MNNKLLLEKKTIRNQIEKIFNLLIVRYSSCVKAISFLDKKLAEKVITENDNVDSSIENVERKIILSINLYQPVARDLRELITYVKLLDSLSRINEILNNMAISTCRISKKKTFTPPLRFFSDIAPLVKKIFLKVLKAFEKLDKKLAEEAIKIDDAIDQEYRTRLSFFIKSLESEGETKVILRLINIDKSFERIGDLAEKMARELLYIF